MFASYIAALRTYSRDVRIILVASAISSFTMDGVFPVVFNLYILRMGFDAGFVGTVNAIGLLLFSVAALPAGSIGTRFGARTAMVVGVTCTLISAWAVAFTDLLPTSWIPWWITIAYSLLYVGIAFYWVNSSPALINLSPKAEQQRVISVQSAMGNLLAFIGGPLAGLLPVVAVAIFGWTLDDPAPYRLPLILTGAIYLVAFLLIIRIKPVPTELPTVGGHSPGAPTMPIPFFTVLVITSIMRFMMVSAVGATNTFFNVFMDEGIGVSPAVIGAIIAVARLAAVFVALMVPYVTERYGTANTAIWAGVGTALAIIPMALFPVWQLAGLGYLGMQTMTSLRYNAQYVYLMSITPPQLRTAMTGAGEFSGGLAFAFFAWIGGFMIVRYGFDALFISSAMVTLAGCFIFWVFVRWWSSRTRELELSNALAEPDAV
jgi:MFS family permease